MGWKAIKEASLAGARAWVQECEGDLQKLDRDYPDVPAAD